MFLAEVEGGLGPIPGAGVSFVRDGRVVPGSANPFGADVAGRHVVDLLAEIEDLVLSSP